jgi:hypothetical protein
MKKCRVVANHEFPTSRVGIFYLGQVIINSKKLRQCCHVDMTVKGGSGCEVDTGSTGNANSIATLQNNIHAMFTANTPEIL